MRYLLPLLGLIIAALVAAILIIGSSEVNSDPKAGPPNRIAAVDEDNSLVAAIKARPDLSRFYRLLSEGGQLDRLREDKYTIIAPDNRALFFNQGTVERLAVNRKDLRSVLKFHIVKGRVKKLSHLNNLTSIRGDELSVSVDGKKKFIQDGRVKDRQKTSNGTIYIVDQLLMPPGTY